MKLHHLICTSGIFLLACGELISPDVAEVVLTLNSPADSLITAQERLPFWWEAHPDAEAYRLQAVSPDFDSPLRILDTLVMTDRLDLSLAEGRYQWRIRVENESAVAAWQQRTLTIDRTPPVLPQAIYPQVASILSAGMDPLELRWLSADPPVSGERGLVSDSIYLYQLLLGQPSLLAAYETAVGSSQLAIAADLPPVVSGDTLRFQWRVRSRDQAGNAGPTATFSFSLR